MAARNFRSRAALRRLAEVAEEDVLVFGVVTTKKGRADRTPKLCGTSESLVLTANPMTAERVRTAGGWHDSEAGVLASVPAIAGRTP